MIESSYSLYKLIVLYALKKANFPLTNSQISDIVLSGNYTTYFHLQEVLTEMKKTGLLSTKKEKRTTWYEMTPEGEQTLQYFEEEISPEIRREISNYLVMHEVQMRNDSSVLADYFHSSDQDYIVNCVVKEGKRSLVEIQLSVPTESVAKTLADNWKSNAQECYAAIMKILSK